jgi:RES domain-containing protein
VYVSGSLALAALETFVHFAPSYLPADYVAIRVEVPDGVRIDRFAAEDLPASWRDMPGPDVLKSLGSEWAGRSSSVALAVPSAIIPQEDNYLLNPSHPDFSRLTVALPVPFVFDSRLRK